MEASRCIHFDRLLRETRDVILGREDGKQMESSVEIGSPSLLHCSNQNGGSRRYFAFGRRAVLDILSRPSRLHGHDDEYEGG